jgi:hypothetical protein
MEDTTNFEGYELAVIHTSFKHGQISWGWDEERKIILPDLNPCNLEQRRCQYRQAELMVEAFNNDCLTPPHVE